MGANCNKIYTSHKRSKYVFAWSLIGASRVIFINKVLYSIITHRTKKQHRNPIGFYVLQNLNPFGFHKLYKFCELQMPLKALRKIVVQGMKQTFKFANHLQVWQNLNYQIGCMGHTMNPYGMWNPNIKNLSNNTSYNPSKNRNPISSKCCKPNANQIFFETPLMYQSLYKDLNKIINTWSNHHTFKGQEN